VQSEMVSNRTNRRPAFTRSSRSGRHALCVTERDLKAVEDVGRFRFLTARQLLQLHWPRPSQRRHGESRLRELFHAGWLARQPFGSGLGHPLAVYSLGPKGRAHVAATSATPAAGLRARPVRERNHDPLFLKHHLQTVQIVINLAQAAEIHGGGLVHYRDERLLRADWAEDRAANRVVPDAFIVLAIGARTQSFCIELDRATVDAVAWRRRLGEYLAWTRTGRFTRELMSPSVLLVVEATPKVAQRRVQQLKELVDEAVGRDEVPPYLFWLSTLDAVGPDAVLDEAVWLAGGREGLHRLYQEE
jgi:hypothetical protein